MLNMYSNNLEETPFKLFITYLLGQFELFHYKYLLFKKVKKYLLIVYPNFFI